MLPVVPILRGMLTTMVSSKSTPSSGLPPQRRYPIGVEIFQDQHGSTRTHARVWATDCKQVELVTSDGAATPLTAEGNGYYSGVVDGLGPGSLYKYRLDGANAFPDPVSRFQPEGPHGQSMVVDPGAYDWGDAEWRGVTID